MGQKIEIKLINYKLKHLSKSINKCNNLSSFIVEF